MQYYLSSYKIGDQPQQLAHLFSHNKKIAYIPNALDSHSITPEWRTQHIQSDMRSLQDLGLDASLLDLTSFFGKKDALREALHAVGGVYISGGNVFILRQAMRLSGFDTVLASVDTRFVYAGYSAAACVLSPRLDAYSIVDDPHDMPYPQHQETIWEGLGSIEYVFLPHYHSAHSESQDINKEISYCIEHKLLFMALRDGEVLVFEK